MLMHQAISKCADGEFKIDLNVIRQMAEAFDDGVRTEECIIAKFIVAAYEMGVERGIQESEDRHLQTAMLLACTAGNA